MLKVIRQNLGYKQTRVAELLGYKTSALLCNWENEVAMPSSTNLMKLCILYNKTPAELYPEYYKRLARGLSLADLL